MSSSTQKSSCGSRIHNINSGAFFLPKGEEHDRVLESRALKNPRPVSSFSKLHFSWKGKNVPMKSLVFKPYTQIWGSTFCKSCLLIFLCLLALEEPKWYSKPELSWHSNDLGIASPLYGPPDENQGLLHAQRFMHISLQDVLQFLYKYHDIQKQKENIQGKGSILKVLSIQDT